MSTIERRISLFIIFLFISFDLFGKGDWHFPDLFGYSTYSGDTGYFYQDNGHNLSKQGVDWLRKGNTIDFFYFSGNLCAEASIKEAKIVKEREIGHKIRFVKYFVLDGSCIIYYDDSTKLIAARGLCKDNHLAGEWNYYDKKGRIIQRTYPIFLCSRSDFYDSSGVLIERLDKVNCVDQTIVVRDIIFKNGKATVLVRKMLLDILILRYMRAWMIIFFICFFSRIFINSIIYNRENNTHYSPIYFFAPFYRSNNYSHSLICTFTLWFYNYKPENRKLVLLSNTLSGISLAMFFGMIILFGINGDLH